MINDSEFKIDKDIPLEKHGGVGKIKTKYPWNKMVVGDSVKFANMRKFRAATGSVYNHVRGNPPQQFRCRSTSMRIWRIT